MSEHQYPQGAVQSVETIRELLARVWVYGSQPETVYFVHGLGSQSFTSAYEFGRNSKIAENHIGISVRTNGLREHSEGFFFADANIGGHHNRHYIFLNKADADAYLEYAKLNTPDIERDTWDWDIYD